jgi:hypothetical protein
MFPMSNHPAVRNQIHEAGQRRKRRKTLMKSMRDMEKKRERSEKI